MVLLILRTLLYQGLALKDQSCCWTWSNNCEFPYVI